MGILASGRVPTNECALTFELIKQRSRHSINDVGIMSEGLTFNQHGHLCSSIFIVSLW